MSSLIHRLKGPNPQKSCEKPERKEQKRSLCGQLYHKFLNFITPGSLRNKVVTHVDDSNSENPSPKSTLSIPVNPNNAISVKVPKEKPTESEKNNGNDKNKASKDHITDIIGLNDDNSEVKEEVKELVDKSIDSIGHEGHHGESQNVGVDQAVTNMAGLSYTISAAALSIMTATSQTTDAYQQYKEARDTNDYWGKVNSGLDLTNGTLQILSGVATISASSLSIATKKTAKATNTVAISQLQNSVKEAGIARLSLLSIKTILNMHHSISFAKGLKNAIGTLDSQDEFSSDQIKNGLNYLVSQLEISPEELNEAQKKCANKSQESIGEEPVTQNSPLLNTQEKAHCTRTDGSWDHVLAKELINLKKQKKARFIRAAGKETFDKVSKLLHDKESKKNRYVERQDWFSNLNDEEVKEAKALFAEIGTSTKDILLKQKVSIAKLAVYAAGIALLILSIAGTGGALGMVVLVGSILIALIYLIQDLKELWELYKEGKLTAKDKMLLGLTVGLLTISVALDIIFPSGAGTLVRSGIIEGLWILIYGYSYMRNSRNQHKKTENKSVSDSSSKPKNPKPQFIKMVPLNNGITKPLLTTATAEQH